jgi:Spy/CpxP family protein refolding chaperone
VGFGYKFIASVWVCFSGFRSASKNCNREVSGLVTNNETRTQKLLTRMKTNQNMKRNILTLTAVGAIALGGLAFAGGQGGPNGGGWHRHGHGFGLQGLTKTLNLSADQQAKVKPILDQAKPQIIAIHKDARQKSQAVISNAMSQIRPLLNADQQKKFDDLQKARQDMRTAMQELHNAMQE